jgi:hypothetical protein
MIYSYSIDLDRTVLNNLDVRYRRAGVKVTVPEWTKLLLDHLDLPDDVYPIGISYEFDTDSWVIKMCSARFDEVQEGEAMPILRDVSWE